MSEIWVCGVLRGGGIHTFYLEMLHMILFIVSIYFPASLVVQTSTLKPMTGSTAKVAKSRQLSSASQHPRHWLQMEMGSTGPHNGGRLHPQVSLQPRASRPLQAQLAPTSSKSLLCDSKAGGWNSTQQEEIKKKKKRRGRRSRFHYNVGRTMSCLTRSTGGALYSREATGWCLGGERWCGALWR